ncbi:MAG: terpene cyclase/mutase family protein [Candidatus Bathyarchaeota archaeon]|nr:terpene cyclase/mutase family protein [Candidatus Bathyarchaeota archaeon]MDH5494233.1 terpene cyclase/mutase family protein [Candidatus Bathyarchaeota archaeon]
MNIEAALNFIQEHGNTIDRYRINYLLNERHNDEIPLKNLRSIQNKDGGFPYNLEKDKHSSVSETCSTLNLIRELDLKESNVCKKAIQFLFKTQQQNGSWDENLRIAEYKPPPWDTPAKPETRTWLTAEVANKLIQLGYHNSEYVRKAAKFLMQNRDKNGKVAGYRIATWITISVFAQLEGIENEIVQKSMKLVEEWLQEEEIDASFLNWYLECLHDAKIPRNHPLVQICLEKLVKLQQKNGSWTSVDGERYIVPTTITALKLLRDFDVWTAQGK